VKIYPMAQTQLTGRNLSVEYVEKLEAANSRLSKKLQEMITLLDISTELALAKEELEVLELVADAISGQIIVNNLAVYLLQEDGEIHLKLRQGFQPGDLVEKLKIDPGWYKEFLGIYDGDHTESEFIGLVCRKLGDPEKIKSLIPVVRGEDFYGLIVLGKKSDPGGYQKDDIEFLTILGGTTAAALEKILYHKQSIIKERMDEDLAVARHIQQSLLPPNKLLTHWFNLAAICSPTYKVGGDFYDYTTIPGVGTSIAIGDISGKGVSASILMSYLLAVLRSLIRVQIDLTGIVTLVNKILLESTNSEQFTTLFFGILEDKTRSLSYINAGHPAPVLVHKDGAVNLLPAEGIILGAFPAAKYSLKRVSLSPGDILVLYTDGVPDTQNSRGDYFSPRRLMELVKLYRHLDAEHLRDAILSEIEKFQHNEPQFDDLTLMVIEILGGAQGE